MHNVDITVGTNDTKTTHNVYERMTLPTNVPNLSKCTILSQPYRAIAGDPTFTSEYASVSRVNSANVFRGKVFRLFAIPLSGSSYASKLLASVSPLIVGLYGASIFLSSRDGHAIFLIQVMSCGMVT